MFFDTSRIKFGLSIIFDKDIYKAIDFASVNRFSSIELWSVAPQFLIGSFSKKEKIKISEYAKEKKIQLQLHAPEDISFFEPNEEIWQGYFLYLQKLINFARDLKAISLTIHPGELTAFTYPNKQKVSVIEKYPKYFREIFKRNLEPVCGRAKDKIFLCIENTNNFKQIMKVIDEFLKPQKIFLTWDIPKTYNKDGTIKKEEFRFFVQNIKTIRNIHLHDATFLSGHEIIGKGLVDFSPFFSKVKDLDVNYIIEVRPHLNVIKSRNNLLRILNNNTKI